VQFHQPSTTNIYIRVWTKKVNGDWVYDDYELETEAKTPATKQVTRSYLVTDHLDTPRFIYNDEQALTWRWASDGFGRQAANDDPDGDGYQVNVNLGFPGQYKDLESGLVYNWNRYYDSELGRYVTSDPIGLGGGLNTYGYVYQNPTKYIDPDGKFAFLLAIPFIGGGTVSVSGSTLFGATVFAGLLLTPSDSQNFLPDPSPLVPETPSIPQANASRGEEALQSVVDGLRGQTESISVPVPPRQRGKYACIARIQDLNRSGGQCPVFGWGWGLDGTFQKAKNDAVQMANLSVGAKDTHHAQWRCISPKGDILRP